MTTAKLNIRQRTFIAEYLKDLNATQAYIRAGYSPLRAHVASSKLLANISIQAALQEAKSKREQRLLLKQDDVLIKLKSLMEANMADYARWDGQELMITPSDQLTRQQAYCIQEVSMDREGRMKIKLHDKIRAAQAILDHTGPESDLDASKNIDININIIGRDGIIVEHQV